MPKPSVTVLLWEHAGTGLIVPYQTGVAYANQVGGNACLQLECEGFFVPIANEVGLKPDYRLRSPENLLFDFFRRNASWDGLTEKHVNAIEAAFVDFPLWKGSSVNRQKLDQSYES